VSADPVGTPARAVRAIKIAWIPEDRVVPEFGMIVGPVIRVVALFELEPKERERILDFIEISNPNSLTGGSKGLFPLFVLRHRALSSMRARRMISYIVSSSKG